VRGPAGDATMTDKIKEARRRARSQILSEMMDKRIDDLLRAPRMYGSPEAVEMQFLSLLEIQAEIESPKTPSRFVFDRYERFIVQNFLTTTRPLHKILDNNIELLAQKLKEFRILLRAEGRTWTKKITNTS